MTGAGALDTIASAGKEAIRGFIAELEHVCGESEDQIEIPIQHYFSKGVYAREITIPKGGLIVGKIHRHQNMNVLSAGEVSVLTDDGVKRMKAPATFVAPPGAKRVIFAHADSVWTVFHGTDETDLDKIEDEFIAKTYDDVVPVLEDKPTHRALDNKLTMGSQKCLG